MRVSRLKTQVVDFASEHNEYGNRKPMKIIGDELGLGASAGEEFCMATEITVRVGPGWRNWKKMQGCIVRRRMPTKLI